MKETCRNCLTAVMMLICQSGFADDFEHVLRPLLSQNCEHCHSDDESNADINFQQISSRDILLKSPRLILKALKVIDNRSMPPESEPPISEDARRKAIAVLQNLLLEATATTETPRLPIRRLNRFQYNNTVRDLFQLNRNVFALPEKLMTRYDSYLQTNANQTASSPSLRAKMPDVVHVASHSLAPSPGLNGVKAFPKDLRAEHGFDNQASQLTLSPLLLDAFLKLSISIVESPDFNAETVGIWNQFFAEPISSDDVTSADRRAEIQHRLTRFLRHAFRGPVDENTVQRYTDYALLKMEQGLSFTDSMKKVAAAALSSPMFLYRSWTDQPELQQFALASRLSYFLWGSCPDEELLKLAEMGNLSDPNHLNTTIDRMLADPRIERFLDSFPSQWMQLENVLAATPDPGINRYFRLDPATPASAQMILEPLLLFDAVFVENRPLIELIAPRFGYQSDFLKTWYTTSLKPPAIDLQEISRENQRRDDRRSELQSSITQLREQLAKLGDPIRKALLQQRADNAQSESSHGDLQPFAVWDFDGNLQESVRQLNLTAHGEIDFHDGMIRLDKSYLISEPLPIDLKAKTLEIWFVLQDPDQRGGGLMGIQGQGDFFDTVVLGERQNRHWISGSNGFSRTKDFPGSVEETGGNEVMHLAMVYADDGRTTLYRNGQPYGQPFQKGQATFPAGMSSVIFGLRHLPPGGNRFLSVSIDRACLYHRALSAEEVAASAVSHDSFISEQDLLAAMTPEQRAQRESLIEAIGNHQNELNRVPANIDPQKAVRDAERDYDQEILRQLKQREFRRVQELDPRYGGIITNAAVLSMTSGPKRTHPVARGVWVIEVIFNNPPSPPPNDVPPLNEDALNKDLTIREHFAAHRDNPTCSGCHSKLDPLGFALENFDITGRWRQQYDNGRKVDASGVLLRKYEFSDVAAFKESIVTEPHRFAKAFTEHLLRFALTRELEPIDAVTVNDILTRTQPENFELQSVIRAVIQSKSFLGHEMEP